jgi:beta-glucanase (GH16 family)
MTSSVRVIASRARGPSRLVLAVMALALAACSSPAGTGESPDDAASASGGRAAPGSGASGAGSGGVGSGGTPGTGGAIEATGGVPAAGSGGGRGMGSGGVGSGGASGVASGGRPGSGGASNPGGAAGSAATDACGRPSAITVPGGYTKLVWHDEFDGEGAPSSANWGYEQGFVRNEELQWYQPDNVSVGNGLLTITARRETKANPNYKAGSSDWKTNRQSAAYTSSSMTTSGKQSWQYGRFELCAKIPISNGMWPAWWTLGLSGQWPSNGEIDIMEFYKGKILANVGCGTATAYQPKWDSVSKAVDAAWAAKFHVWRMDWNSTQIDLYVDDTLMNDAKLADMLNADGKSPFMQKAYMILNLAIGGQNGGDPSGTTFPQLYQVDYVRVFQ